MPLLRCGSGQLRRPHRPNPRRRDRLRSTVRAPCPPNSACSFLVPPLPLLHTNTPPTVARVQPRNCLSRTRSHNRRNAPALTAIIVRNRGRSEPTGCMGPPTSRSTATAVTRLHPRSRDDRRRVESMDTATSYTGGALQVAPAEAGAPAAQCVFLPSPFATRAAAGGCMGVQRPRIYSMRRSIQKTRFGRSFRLMPPG
jgi:hypothetical protein